MGTVRDDFTAETKRVLRERVGGRCSRPECGQPTISPNKVYSQIVDITGRAAHITAARTGGPRFDPLLSRDQRRSADNGIWLCSDCADLIDKNAGDGFSVELLRSWKRNAEESLFNATRLRVRRQRPTWLDRLRTPHYVNVPRILHIVGTDVLSAETLEVIEQGFPRDGMIVRELVEVQSALRRWTVEAVDVRELVKPESQLAEGLMISYHSYCRSKNGSSQNPDDVTNYSFAKSPLVYLDCNHWRYVQPYDPIWLTTNTAIGTVRRGSCTLAGIAIVKCVDRRKKQVIASPLTFGIPDIFGVFE
jgi:hypothetical protein